MPHIQDDEQDIPRWETCIRPVADHIPSLEWNYAIKGWLLRRETSLLYGPSNVGKSALVCRLGCCIVGETCSSELKRTGGSHPLPVSR